MKYHLTLYAQTNENHVPRLHAHWRQFTGTPKVYTSYVYDNNRPVAFCGHKHRSGRTADACSKRMLRHFKSTRGDS